MLLPAEGCGSASLAALAAVIGAPPALTHKRLRLQKVTNNTVEFFMTFRSLPVNILRSSPTLRYTTIEQYSDIRSYRGNNWRVQGT